MNKLFVSIMIFFFLALMPIVCLAESITLAWDPPASYTDGNPLKDLIGYSIHYGTRSGKYTDKVTVGNVSTYTVEGLEPGITYYFVVRARDKSGKESSFSKEISAIPKKNER